MTEQAQPITEWPTPPHENVTEEKCRPNQFIFFGGSLFMALSISAIIFGYTFNLSFNPVQYNGWTKCMNDTPTDWRIGWTGSGHYSVFEVSIEPKFKGVLYTTKHWPTTIFWCYHMTMLNACAEAHAFAPLRCAHAVEMWYFGELWWITQKRFLANITDNIILRLTA